MSRSNTPSGHNGQQPPALVPGAQGQQQWRMPPELEVPPSRGAPGQLPAAGQYAQPGQLPPGYAYPPQTYGQAPGAADQGYGYATQPPAPGGHQFAPPPTPAPGYAPQDRYAAAPQMSELRGSQFDQWPNQPAAAPVSNPQNYDLGNYNPAMPGSAQATAYQQPTQQPTGPAYHQPMPDFNQPQPSAYASAAYGNYAPPQAEYPQPQWSPQDIAAYQAQQAGPHGAVNYDQQGYVGQPQAGYPAAGHTQGTAVAAGQVQAAGPYDDEEEFEEEEPRRRGRGLMVVAALVGAIGLGGGLAYGYKTFMKPPTSGNIPVARADKNPAKIKPATPDGKQMAGSSSTLQNGADASAPIRPVQAAPTANADAEGNASRKVQTMQIGRDGSIAAPTPQQTPQQTQSTTVPGMQMVFPSTPTQQRVMPVPNLPEAQPAPAAPVQSRVVAAVPPPMNAPVTATPAPAPPKKVAQLPVPKKPTTRDDLAANGGSALGAGEAAPAAAPRKPSGAGFMPVISLQKTEIDAMRTWADLQEKIPALQGKKPITQVIEPGSKYSGMYRLMVGPPGSSAAAKDTCGQLKPAGINDCYVAAY